MQTFCLFMSCVRAARACFPGFTPLNKQYVDDFPLIEKLVESFSRLYTTPNGLTEVSNLGRKAGSKFYDRLNALISLLEEQYCASREATQTSLFGRLGLTDSVLFTLGPKFLIVTADFGRYMSLRAQNVDAVNFNHLRLHSW